jgi:hypothetical protein
MTRVSTVAVMSLTTYVAIVTNAQTTPPTATFAGIPRDIDYIKNLWLDANHNRRRAEA